MIVKNKKKKCKGTGIAKGCGCEVEKQIFKYGLCKNCYAEWLFNTEEGKEKIKKTRIRAKKKVEKDIRKKNAELKRNNKEKKELLKDLQSIINDIVRLIDIDKPCISCNYIGNGRQWHAGHFYSVGSHPNIRFNLWNIHKQCSVCNTYKHGNLKQYVKGLEQRYKDVYRDKIEPLRLKKSSNYDRFQIENAIKKARIIKKRMLSGEEFSRDSINLMIDL